MAENCAGARASFALAAMPVCQFFHSTRSLIEEVGGNSHFNGKPNEIPGALRFADDRLPRPYDPERVERYHRVLVTIAEVLSRFRTAFTGKVSPVHLFWGSFDLAVTRFSGRSAPLHPGGIPNLPDNVTREAYSHEVSSAGFWPGGGGMVEEPCFYSYAYPAPEQFSEAVIHPEAARFHEGLSEFILPYAAVRNADDPEASLMAFLQSTYTAAADLGHWSRAEFDCQLGVPGRPRPPFDKA